MKKKNDESRNPLGGDGAPPAAQKKDWEQPKLAFVAPRLTNHGKLEKVTRGKKQNGFFGEFSP